MSDGLPELDAMIARLKRLGTDLPAEVAREAAPAVQRELERTAGAGESPTGEAWRPKKDGGRPLVHAAQAFTTRALGPLVVTTLTGPEVFHQKGTRRTERRQIIPDSGDVPEGVARAVTEAAGRVFERITRGGGG